MEHVGSQYHLTVTVRSMSMTHDAVQNTISVQSLRLSILALARWMHTHTEARSTRRYVCHLGCVGEARNAAASFDVRTLVHLQTGAQRFSYPDKFIAFQLLLRYCQLFAFIASSKRRPN